MKYQPQFPKRFGCIQDAKSFCRDFFQWYNCDHHHLGIGLMTPDQVHYGQADAVHAARQNTLDHAFRINPQRFVNKAPNHHKNPRQFGSTRQPKACYPSLKYQTGCLIVVDTFRGVAGG